MDPTSQRLLHSATDSVGVYAVATVSSTSPYVNAWRWVEGVGFGGKYSDPSTLPGNTMRCVDFSTKNSPNAICMGGDGTPNVHVYKFSYKDGFGTKYSDPGSTIFGGVEGIKFVKSNTAGVFDPAIVMATTGGSFIYGFPWDFNTGFGTKYSDPSTLPTNFGQNIDVNASGSDVIIAHTGSPYTTAYPFNSSTGFGTKYSDPSTLPGSTAYAVNIYGTGLLVGTGLSPYIHLYAWTSGLGFGTKFSDPASPPAGLVNEIDNAYSSPNLDVVMSHQNSPYITSYAISLGFSTKRSNPSTLPTGNANCIRVTNAINGVCTVFVGHANSPYITAYSYTPGTGFGSKYSDPATLPGAAVLGVAVSNQSKPI